MGHGERQVSTSKKGSFGSLKISANNPVGGVVPPVAAPAVEDDEHEQLVERAPAAKKPARGKPPKTVPVRMTHEQWYQAKEFGMQFDTSLQELFIQGLNMVRASKGLPPLPGTKMLNI
jgi:hypothetical protein